MSNKTVEGVIQGVARNNKSFVIDDTWYSAFNPGQLNGAAQGDKVSFTFKEKDVGGKVYNNVVGNLNIVSSDGSSTSTSATTTKKYSRGSFPIDPLDGQRSIIRQNALTNAREALISVYVNGGVDIDAVTTDEMANDIIMLARMFEEYTAGDLDAKAAEAAVNTLSETED